MAVVTILGFGAANAVSASAATTVSATSQATAHRADPANAPSANPDLTPKGCNGVNFCSYNQTNGGHLCFQTDKNVDVWPAGCANENQSAYNRNGNAVQLYYEEFYGGAWYILYSGNYLLYMSQNRFNNCSGCAGYGQQMADNVASSRFV